MFEPLLLRDDGAPELIVVVRLGVVTLADQRLTEACERTYARWGVRGFSVLEVPNGDDFAQLARLRPEVRERRQVLIANGRDLLADGFPLLPTLDYPHWTLQLSETTADRFELVRSHFSGPMANPAYRE